MGQCQAVISRRKAGVEVDRPLKKRPGALVFLRLLLQEMPEPAMIGFSCIEALRGLAHDALPLGLRQGRLDRHRNALGDLVLDGKDVAEIAVVALGRDARSYPPRSADR